MDTTEFVRTNPLFVGRHRAFVVDTPHDRPPYVGLVFHVISRDNPLSTVQYTFKLSGDAAHDLGVALSLLGPTVE